MHSQRVLVARRNRPLAGSSCLALLPAALMHAGLLRDRLVVLPVADELAGQRIREAEYLKRP
jgi:hypothetical protein